MDSAGLTILLRELAADCEVARDAAHKAAQLARLAEQLAADLPQWCADFGEKVRAEQGWD